MVATLKKATRMAGKTVTSRELFPFDDDGGNPSNFNLQGFRKLSFHDRQI
jgi:hypothetical protein